MAPVGSFKWARNLVRLQAALGPWFSGFGELKRTRSAECVMFRKHDRAQTQENKTTLKLSSPSDGARNPFISCLRPPSTSRQTAKRRDAWHSLDMPFDT
jgi:hypothetical protein